jgi:thiamine kinase-like enzyme
MKKLGEGISAQVYTDGVYAYKIYHKGYSIHNMKFETQVQNEIYRHTDLNVAKYEIINDQIRMTLFEGKTLAERIIKENYLEGFNDFIELQMQFFKYEHLNLADSFQTFSTQIKQTDTDDDLKQRALDSLNRIKKVYVLCHFDYHPENVMYHKNVPYVIDWTNAKLGNPVMDIASTYIIFRLYAEKFADMYLNTMISKGFELNEIKAAIPVMAFIRFRETKEENLCKLLKDFINGDDKTINHK